jgi:hypothetical protein
MYVAHVGGRMGLQLFAFFNLKLHLFLFTSFLHFHRFSPLFLT